MNKENLEFDEATRRGADTLAASPKAKAVSYNARLKRISVELENGAVVVIPSRLIQILHDATAAQINDVEIAVGGLYLRWASLDEDLFVPNLIQGVFGTRQWIGELKEHLSAAGRKGGAVSSEVKRRSSATNGKKGGRPRKIPA